jgi:uncharacterized membrane protein YbhN (UPF0104 family)
MNPVRRWRRWTLGALVFSLATWLLWRQLRGLGTAQLQAALAALPTSAIALCLAATALSFGCLALYERLATQWLAPGKVPLAVAWRTGLVAHALANTLGFHPLTAVALRLRAYRAHGIDAATLAKIVAAIGACVAAGVAATLVVAGAWSLWMHGQQELLVVLVVSAGTALAVLELRPRRASLRLPMLAHAGVLFALGLLEMGAATGALAVLLPAGALPDGPAFVLLFVTATLLGIASHAPGGLGVFEATMLAAAAPAARAQVLAALLAYRVLYNLLPCALALLAVAGGAVRERLGRGLSSTAGTHA